MKKWFNIYWIFCLIFILSLIQSFSTIAGESSVYRIGPEDIVTITIIAGGEEEAKADLVVSLSGDANVPFIGMIKAAGLTPIEFEDLVMVSLKKDFFIDPQVHIQIKSYHSLKNIESPENKLEIKIDSNKRYAIQIGAFLNQKNANRKKKELLQQGVDSRILVLQDTKKRNWYLLRLGDYPDKKAAQKFMLSLNEKLGIKSVVRPFGSL